jgi:hypothetical protein
MLLKHSLSFLNHNLIIWSSHNLPALYFLYKIYTRIQKLATETGKQNPVFRAVLTGIIVFNIVGKTFYNLLRLLIKGKKSDLSVATL